MVRGVLVLVCLFISSLAQAEPHLVSQSQDCSVLEIPQNDNGFTVVGTYGGKQFEFRITVDGKPMSLAPQEANKDSKALCAFTS